MRYTDADVRAMLESVNNQIALNGDAKFYLLKVQLKKYQAMYQLKTVESDREMSQLCDAGDMHEILAVLVRVLQHIGLQEVHGGKTTVKETV